MTLVHSLHLNLEPGKTAPKMSQTPLGGFYLCNHHPGLLSDGTLPEHSTTAYSSLFAQAQHRERSFQTLQQTLAK